MVTSHTGVAQRLIWRSPNPETIEERDTASMKVLVMMPAR